MKKVKLVILGISFCLSIAVALVINERTTESSQGLFNIDNVEALTSNEDCCSYWYFDPIMQEWVWVELSE